MTERIKVLDHGFVELMDVMGSDEDIETAARVSFTGGDEEERTTEQRRGILRYLMRHRHCYAPWMEVLTADGWKRWDECGPEETFMVPDPEERVYRAEKLPIEAFDADEDMITFKSQRMSFCVTGDHRMWFKGKYKNEFEIVRAAEMRRWGHFDPLIGYRPLELNATEWDPSWEFVGFYLGDGSHASKWTVTFHLRKQRKKEYLKELLASLGWDFTEKKSATHEDGSVFTVHPSPGFFDKISGHGFGIGARAKDKGVNPSLFGRLNIREREMLWEGLVSSDGHRPGDRPAQVQFSTSSATLAKQFETLGMTLGYDVHSGREQRGVLRLSAYSSDTRTSLEARAQYFGREHYQGQVYCATTSTGLLAVRGGSNEFGFVCGNTTPFEMAEMKFRVCCPIFVWRQWIRHRTASVNEISGRYTTLPDLYYVPDPSRINKQSKSNKQGSTRETMVGADLYCEDFREEQRDIREKYEARTHEGMAKELARINVPVSQYTVAVWKMDLHNLMHFLSLRLDPHAQWEIRQYAEAIAVMVQERFPITWEAFEDYRRNAMFLTAQDVAALSKFIRLLKEQASLGNGDFQFACNDFKTAREAGEFQDKLNAIVKRNP